MEKMLKQSNTLFLTGIVLFMILPFSNSYGDYICPSGLDNPGTVESLKIQYTILSIAFEDRVLYLINQYNESALSDEELIDLILDENGEKLDDIGNVAECLIMARTDPNLVKEPNTKIVSILESNIDRVQLVTPNYAVHVIGNLLSKSQCSNVLVKITQEEYRGKINSIESDLKVLLDNPMRTSTDSLVQETYMKYNLEETIFSDPQRKVDLLDDFQYLKNCNAIPQKMMSLPEDVRDFFKFDPTLSATYLLFSYDISPKKQSKMGISNDDIKCGPNMTLIIKNIDDSPACTNFRTAEVLEHRGWGIVMSNKIQ